MIEECTGYARSLSWGKILSIAIVMILVLIIAMPPGVAPRAHPVLFALARERPEARVGVVVQKQVADTSIEQTVVSLGGVITKDLRLINAFAADVPAHALPALANTAGVRWVSPDAPLLEAQCSTCVDTSKLANAYIRAIGADQLWNKSPSLQGQDITVAVVDSGLVDHSDIESRIIATAKFNSDVKAASDGYGHGTHVAGIIGGDGSRSSGTYIGVAPKVNLVSVKVGDNQGAGSTSDVVAGLQWIYENKNRYNIRVVNLSLNSTVAESYHTSPLDAAVEILWFNGIVVVVSAGNNGLGADNGILYPPANDPFVITVGAADDRGTAEIGDDTLAPFSAYGTTESGVAKPDLVAPGTNIVSLLSSRNAELAKAHPDHLIAIGESYDYFRISGTSMASAVTAGAAALLLQDEPSLTPDQVKYRLIATARPFESRDRAGAGSLDVLAAVNGTTTESANTGVEASHLLQTGSDPMVWNSVNWGSVNWGSVNWGSVNWGSVNWGSLYWGD